MRLIIAVVWTFGVALGFVWVVRNPTVYILSSILRLIAPSLGHSKAYINICESFAIFFIVIIVLVFNCIKQ